MRGIHLSSVMKNKFIKKTVRHRRNQLRKTLEHGRGFHALWPGRINTMKIYHPTKANLQI